MNVDLPTINQILESEDAIDLVFGAVERDMFPDVDAHSTHTFRCGSHLWTVVDTTDCTQLCSQACLEAWAADAGYPSMVMADVLSQWEVWTVPHYVDPENMASAVAHPFYAADVNPDVSVTCSNCGRMMLADEPFRSYVERALDAYLTCALWSSYNCDENGETGEPLDANYEPGDLDEDAAREQLDDVVRFIAAQWSDLRDLDARSVGHDFWLTRNGHGAGFWDRGYGPRGDRLSEAARVYGPVDLYVDCNGRIAC